MSHLRSEDIEAFLRGEEPTDAAAFRRHASACAECARRLADEARIDDVLAGAAVNARTPARRLSWAAAAAILFVFIVLVAIRMGPNRPETPAATVPVAIDRPGADPATTDPRAEQPAARTLAPNSMGAWTTIEPERLALGPPSSTPPQ